jgi:spermidine synthase
MSSRLLRIAPLLFLSGFCALVYQTTWLREFRLFFGASTAANAAVLAIFMGGLGAGSALLGRRSETQKHPLAFYARLELWISVSAALTPLLLWVAAQVYLAVGGTLTLGLGVGSIVRLLLSLCVLGVPTFLMGGTLPAVARAAVGEEDTNRRALALLYGVNTLGAVTGAALGTFFLFERFGNLRTLLFAAILNALTAFAAYAMAKGLPAVAATSAPRKVLVKEESAAPPKFVLIAAGITGFVFLLMELVWYRMLSPLLGGSTFTFGLILAVALLGIGIGGVAFALMFGDRRATLQGFALTCALEAVFIALPYALGDRVALGAMLLRPLGALGFSGFVLGWTQLCVLVVLPAAIVAGIQFPMLIALLGKGKAHVGAQTGLAYAWNTAGAIAGAIAGGFGFLPHFSAPGVWRLVVVLLGVLALVAAVIDWRQRGKILRVLPPFATAALALWLLTAPGPTAFWRHGQIGVGRQEKLSGSKNDYRDLMNAIRRSILWEKDGVESSVAISKNNGFNFIVNGKTDGSLKGDVGTQVMIGVVPALLHPQPQRALVVGLGTGCTAGWLASVPSITRVDVAELEPAILKVADLSAPMNQDALRHPKVNVILGDAREILLAVRERYDLVVSEPSNPYRAGIASLFTREYYAAAAAKLNDGGMFAQWVQAYEVDNRTIQTIYATMGAVFPHIQTWQTDDGDLLLIGSAEFPLQSAAELRERVAREPFRSALLRAWGVTDLEGCLSHFIAGQPIAEYFQKEHEGPLNTDDQTVLEFAFARNIDLQHGFKLSLLRLGAAANGADRLPVTGEVDWRRVMTGRFSMLLASGEIPQLEDYSSPELRILMLAYREYLNNNLAGAYSRWREQPRAPHDLNELQMLAECAASENGPEAEETIAQLRPILPLEADAFAARLLTRRGDYEGATELLESFFRALRTDPWPNRHLVGRTCVLVQEVADKANTDAITRRLHDALAERFSVYNAEDARALRLFRLALKLDGPTPGHHAAAALAASEPHVPWQESLLRARHAAYQATRSPQLGRATRELHEFLRHQPKEMQYRVAKPRPQG